MQSCQPLQASTLIALGKFLSEALNEKAASENQPLGEYRQKLRHILEYGVSENPWFTPFMIHYCLSAWTDALKAKNVQHWHKTEGFQSICKKEIKTVAVVMAGNLPLVGFHDMLCVLASGSKLLAKLSSSDTSLPRLMTEVLCNLQPSLSPLLELTEKTIKHFDAVIATGSNNTARYFDYYFGKYPNIIRKNRNSIAVLSGNESAEELEKLADDIFVYFGLGCRNVSKLFIPQGFNPASLFPHFEKYSALAHHPKYANNYDYNKSVLLINKIGHFDGGFLFLTENPSLASAISVVHYEYYQKISDVELFISQNREAIQCVVSSIPALNPSIPFGHTQSPGLSDYADDINTCKFLKAL